MPCCPLKVNFQQTASRMSLEIEYNHRRENFHPMRKILMLCYVLVLCVTASVVQWSEFLATDPEIRVRFPELSDFVTSSGSGKGSTQPREYN
jgi:hypothetical protein